MPHRRSTFIVVASGLAICAVPSAALAADSPDWLRFLGRLHPMTVHFPIGLLLAAAGLEFLALFRKRKRVAESAVVCVTLGALAAAAAAWFGWLNADHEPAKRGEALATLTYPRWIGVCLASLAVLAAGFGLATGRDGQRRWAASPYRVLLFITAGLVIVGGHLGGTLVYGEGYLTEVFKSAEPSRLAQVPSPAPRGGGVAALSDGGSTPNQAAGAIPPEGGVAALGDGGGGSSFPATTTDPNLTLTVNFQSQIAPILATRCIGCHGAEKKKGGLRLDARHFVFPDDDPDAWVVIPGDPGASIMIGRITLPAGDPDIMPNEGEPLSPDQIALIRAWIAEGADWPDDAKVVANPAAPIGKGAVGGAGDQNAADKITTAANAVRFYEPTGNPPTPRITIRELSDDERARIAAAINAIRARGGIALPISAESGALEVNLSLVSPPFADVELPLLSDLAPALVWLNLSRSSITGVEPLRHFTELRRLRLDSTAIEDDDLKLIAAFPKLEYLNLVGTRVTDTGLAHLKPMKSLRQLYLWRTDTTDAGIADLKAALPHLAIEKGTP